MSHEITIEGGKTVRLPTAGKYCDRDIVITAEGGTEDLDDVLTEQEELIAELQDILKGKASDGSGSVVQTASKLSNVNLHDVSTDIPNKYIQEAGLPSFNGWYATDYIRMESGRYYLIYSVSQIDTTYCSKFDIEKSYTEMFAGWNTCTNKNSPTMVKGFDGFVRLSGKKAQIDSLEIYEVLNFDWEV